MIRFKTLPSSLTTCTCAVCPFCCHWGCPVGLNPAPWHSFPPTLGRCQLRTHFITINSLIFLLCSFFIMIRAVYYIFLFCLLVFSYRLDLSTCLRWLVPAILTWRSHIPTYLLLWLNYGETNLDISSVLLLNRKSWSETPTRIITIMMECPYYYYHLNSPCLPT